MEHAQRVLKPGMGRAGIHSGSNPKLRDVLESLELGRVNDGTDSGSERDILLHRNADDAPIRVEIVEFGDAQQAARIHQTLRRQSLPCTTES